MSNDQHPECSARLITLDDDIANKKESCKQGISAAPGIAIGRAYIVDRRRLKIFRRRVQSNQVDSEVSRFRQALQKSDHQLEKIKKKITEQENDHYNIITAHQLILRDEHIVDETIRYISNDQVNAEWALRKTVEHIKEVFNSIEDDYFRERRNDVDFVGERILRNLLGHGSTVKPPPNAVIVAHDLSPADTAQLHRRAVLGLATNAGGRTSHTAIIARAHEIPAVVGLENLTLAVSTGDLIVVDGRAGEVIINPRPETLARYKELARKEAAADAALLAIRDLPALSTDDVSVQLMANIEHIDEIPSALEHGAQGIGLFRTEFMFMVEDTMPTEDSICDQAARVLELVGNRKVTFRTMDFGADKIGHLLPLSHSEVNPALGLRSIRLCLTSQMLPIFRSQLRGLLRASLYGNMQIMFPMISGVQELDTARRVFDQVKEELTRDGHKFRDIPVGIMIEMPSAAMIADHLAKRVDFFSIGTNDLIQYTLAVDRVNKRVSYLYEPLHPGLLRLIDLVANAAQRANIPVSVCGEMAGDPLVSSVLIGLGITKLSMHAVAVPEVKQMIRSTTVGELAKLAQRALELASASEVRELVVKHHNLYSR